MNIFYITILLLSYCDDIYATSMTGFLKHAAAVGTQHNRQKNDTKFYTTNSDIPILPFLTGFVGTHGTYRFLTVAEQTLVSIGEGKHGVWRIQENGFVREYRKKGKEGLNSSTDANSASLNCDQHNTIIYNYSHYIPEESWDGYKYPDDRISDGQYDNLTGYLNFVDLTIYHPKYGGKYNNHVPIDLPYYYCTMSGNDFPHAQHVWEFAVKQPMSNNIGPLGLRAGMDIKETHFNVIRVKFFEDAGVWGNIGTENSKNNKAVKNLEELKKMIQSLNYQRIDLSKYNYEIYFIERPFFNKPYLFIAFVLDNKSGPSKFSYIRKNGAYWQSLSKHGIIAGRTDNSENHYPSFYIKNYPSRGLSTNKTVFGLPVYGIHHPNRSKFSLAGGSCPQRGGDWGRYPWSNPGAGFPTNYEEITPLCDALLIDVKVWANLWQKTWEDNTFLLGNAGFRNKLVLSYIGDANIYGKYTDPYLVGKTNPHMMDLTTNARIVQHTDIKPSPITIKLNFTYLGTSPNYNEVCFASTPAQNDQPTVNYTTTPVTTPSTYTTTIFSSNPLTTSTTTSTASSTTNPTNDSTSTLTSTSTTISTNTPTNLATSSTTSPASPSNTSTSSSTTTTITTSIANLTATTTIIPTSSSATSPNNPSTATPTTKSIPTSTPTTTNTTANATTTTTSPATTTATATITTILTTPATTPTNATTTTTTITSTTTATFPATTSLTTQTTFPTTTTTRTAPTATNTIAPATTNTTITTANIFLDSANSTVSTTTFANTSIKTSASPFYIIMILFITLTSFV